MRTPAPTCPRAARTPTAAGLALVRTVHCFTNQDLAGQDQRAFLKALLSKATSPACTSPVHRAAVRSAAASSISVDQGTHLYNLFSAALALRNPQTGTVPIANPNYPTVNAGDAVLWNQSQALQLFNALKNNQQVPASLLSGNDRRLTGPRAGSTSRRRVGMADIGGPRLLLVNDDGAGATGLQKLKAAADTVSDDVWIVAPATERSGASHAISLTQPIRARALGMREFAVDGSPVDCVALALSALLDRPPDLVLSGVNRGPNLAGDILYSGTCGAAREAALRGIPAAALSVAAVPGKADEWGGVDGYLAPLLAQLARARVAAFLNINFPALPARAIAGTQVTRAGSYPADRFTARPGRDRATGPTGGWSCVTPSVRASPGPTSPRCTTASSPSRRCART